jgi:cyclic pyranopterin phosphate synthase
MAAKRTHSSSLCHPLAISNYSRGLATDANFRNYRRASARLQEDRCRDGSLDCVAVACLTIYDMVKAVDRGMRIEVSA